MVPKQIVECPKLSFSFRNCVRYNLRHYTHKNHTFIYIFTNSMFTTTTNTHANANSPSTPTSTSATRPKREASRKVKFIFNDYETEFDSQSPARKRARLFHSHQMATNTMIPLTQTTHFNGLIRQSSEPPPLNAVTPVLNKIKSYQPPVSHSSDAVFTAGERIPVGADEIARIISNSQPRVVLTHSKPFPIALVEDKTNVVHTKALLFLHLFCSYLAPCIHCPWCNKLLNVSEFSKHLHIDQIDDDDDDEEEEDNDKMSDASSTSSDEFDFDTADEKQAYLAQRKKEKKYVKLIKKSFKILPYCFNSEYFACRI